MARLDEGYLDALDTFYALSRLESEIEFKLKRALEDCLPTTITGQAVEDWWYRLDTILASAGTRYADLTRVPPKN